jgi:hypothetical protein
MRLRMNLRQWVWVLVAALALGTGINGSTVRAASPPSSQERAHDQDYSKNKNYRTGMRDGKDDQTHNRDHSKKRHFNKDDDQKAYESGYQQSHHYNK